MKNTAENKIKQNKSSLYETTYILRSDLGQADVEKISNDFNNIIESSEGKVVKKELWGLRELAYKVNKSKRGHYIHLAFEADADTVKELRRKFKLSEEVIRDLTIRVDEFSKVPANLNSKKQEN